MTVPQSPVLEFPAMLYGHISDIRRKLRAKGGGWAREYLKTGAFTQPRKMLQVLPGEVLLMHSGAEFDVIPRPRWQIHMLSDVFLALFEGVPKGEYPRARAAFESFCLSSPWGALAHAVEPYPPRSAERLAQRFAALLRCWDVLEGPRYAYRTPDVRHTLGELIEYIYGMTLEGWCPGEPGSVRERLGRMVERMTRATREDCVQAVFRVIPAVVRLTVHLKHREVLGDADFFGERLAELPPEDWEDVSGADRFAVNNLLCAWDRELGRH